MPLSSLKRLARRVARRLNRAKTVSTAATEPRTALHPVYETRTPSPQTIADIFGPSWKSRLPNVESSGEADMFNDPRVAWLAKVFPGGLAGKSVCEIGPFEGYQTYDFARMGVRDLTSVEANTFNYLKCLCLKEICDFDAKFVLGDGMSFLKDSPRKYDLIFASGVLYHLQDPFEFLRAAMQRSDNLFLWTHYYDTDRIAAHPKVSQYFVPSHDRISTIDGQDYRLHARSYKIGDYLTNIPAYWEGGLKDLTYWIEKDQMLDFLRKNGFGQIKIHADAHLEGMPVLSLFASRDTT